MKTAVVFSIFVAGLLTCSCKQNHLGCADARNGTFHAYPGSGKEHYEVVRNDTLQTEMNLTAGTTSYWKIMRPPDCEYAAKYLSGGRVESKAQEDFYRSKTAKFMILQVAKDYYHFKVHDNLTRRETLYVYGHNVASRKMTCR